VTIPVEDLRAAGLGAQVERLSTTIARYLDDDKHLPGARSNVAVISDPFAGRNSMLDYAEKLLGAETQRVTFSEVVTTEIQLPDLPPDGAIILDNCHYLYQRRIGGFDVLDAFLERLAMSDALVITSWNRYSWDYLSAVRDVGNSFPLSIRIPELTRPQIEAVISSFFESENPEFVDAGYAGRIKTVNVDRRSVGLPGDRSMSVPLLTPNPAWVTSWFERNDAKSIEAVVFEKLRRVSHGNPGVATTLWEQSVRDTEDGRKIAPGYIEDPVEAFTLADDDRAMLLLFVVSMEAVERDALDEMTADISVDTELQALVNDGILTLDGEKIRLRAEGLHPTVAELQRRGLLW
jgi:hypothetical protein